MGSGFILSLIILAVLAGSLWYIVKAEGGYTAIPQLLERVGIPAGTIKPIRDFLPTPKPTSSKKVPAEFQSGDSRFSQGGCTINSNCFVAGCSGEICSSDPDVVSTCEFSESFPSTATYSCTCLPSRVCGWE